MNMAERYEHLTLPFISGDFSRKKRGGGGYKKAERDKNEFYQTELHAFENIQQKFKNQKKRYKDYFDPSLIFKINVNQSVSEDAFRNELRRLGIEVLSPSPDKKGYWVVFTEDEELLEFKKKLEMHVLNNKYDFFYAIEGILDIPPEEKIRESLKKEPFREDEYSYLDIEIWRMDNIKLEKFLIGFELLINSKEGKIVDTLTTKNFCLLRVKVNKQLYDEILDSREVAYVDRPPKLKLETALNTDIQELKMDGKPPDNAAGILVVDSGILSSHPLLENAIGDEIAISSKYSTKISEDEPYDDIGHGTQVAGIALYGDIQKCIENKVFKPEIWIFSAKVMFKDESGTSAYDEEELLEHQLDAAVRNMVTNYANCKVINLSLGDSAKRMFEDRRQFNLASLVDELSKELNVIFVISGGNVEFNIDFNVLDNYPEYLLDDSTDIFKIVDPATSALAITVGALSKYNINPFFDNFAEYPSPITRVGLGYGGMIKPEVVENGGGGFGEESDIITINPNWIKEGRLFTLVKGTSFSAPKVSNYIATLINKYPNKSLNLIKALLISSTSIPLKRPEALSKMKIDSGKKEAINLLKIYGYGKPDIERALFSESNRVILLRENIIKLNHIQIYPVYLPKEFVETMGDRSISVTLVFDPPINKNRVDYLGTTFETHLFKNVAIEDVIRSYSSVKIETEEEEIVPEKIRPKEIKLHPGINLRKKGVHHKGIKEFKNQPEIDVNIPLVLAVICQDRWIKNEEYEQNYAVIVSIEHSTKIDLYNKIRLRNQERVTISLGA